MPLNVSLDVTNAVLEKINPAVVRGLHYNLALLAVIDALGKWETAQSGTEHSEIMEVRDHSLGGQVLEGAGGQRLNFTFQNDTDKASHTFERVIDLSFVTGKEVDEFASAEAQLSLTQRRAQATTAKMMRDVEKAWIANTGRYANKWLTLNGDTNTAAGSSTGIFQAAAFDSQTGTLGNGSHTITRAAGVFATQHQYVDGGGTFDIGDLRKMSTNASIYTPSNTDASGPHVVLAAVNALEEYRGAGFDKERFIKAKDADDLGREVGGLKYEGSIMRPSRDLWTDSSHLCSFLGINLDTIVAVCLADKKFKSGGYFELNEYDGLANKIIFHGGLGTAGSLAVNFYGKNQHAA